MASTKPGTALRASLFPSSIPLPRLRRHNCTLQSRSCFVRPGRRSDREPTWPDAGGRPKPPTRPNARLASLFTTDEPDSGAALSTLVARRRLIKRPRFLSWETQWDTSHIAANFAIFRPRRIAALPREGHPLVGHRVTRVSFKPVLPQSERGVFGWGRGSQRSTRREQLLQLSQCAQLFPLARLPVGGAVALLRRRIRAAA